MKLGLINSAFAQAGKGTAYGLEQTKKIGFDAVDIFTDPLDIDIKERRLIKDTCDRLGLPIKSVCCVALGLPDFNPSVQRFHLDRCRRYLDLCYEYGCENLLLVVGEYIWQKQVIPPEDQWRTAVENVRELSRHARDLGLEIVVELEPFLMSLVNSAETMNKFLADVGQPETVRANVDISHMYLMGIGPDQIERMSGQIGHVHLSDCDGQVHGDLPPGRGVVPLKDYLHAIRDTGFDGTVSIELEYSPEPGRIVERVTEAYEKTDAMMQELGCRG